MRLIKQEADGQFCLQEFIGEDIPPYGILSHTWGAATEEVTLKDLADDTAKRKSGYAKLLFCAERAAADHLQWFWVDTCSIDKTSSAELSEAINSMYRWYHTSTKCYVYLGDVSFEKSEKEEANSLQKTGWKPLFQKSRWFTRGWTLQELLASRSVEFFSKEGKLLGDKRSLASQIQEITGIPERALHTNLFYEFPVDERFSWAKGRKTTREEDVAYSLLGLFDVNMPLLYGEGQRKALARLHREIKDSLPSSQPVYLHDQLQALGLEGESTDHQKGSQCSPHPIYTPCLALDNPPVAAICSSLKEINVFVHGLDSTIKYLTLENGVQTTKNWQSDGKWFSDTPLVFSTRKGQLKIIGPTPYGKVLYQTTLTGLIMQEYWEPIGETVVSPLAGVSWSPNRIDVFGLGTDGQVLQKTLAHGTWLPSKHVWTELGGSFSLPPAVVSTVPGHLHVFCVASYGGYIQHKWWNGSHWTPSGASWAVNKHRCMSPPTAVVTDRTRVEIFVRTPANELSHSIYEEGVWFENIVWNNIAFPGDGINWVSRPAAVLTKGGRVEVFCVASDNELYYRGCSQQRVWERWTSLGGDFASAPTVVASRDGNVHIFCKGYDDEIYYMNLAEKEWKSLGSPDETSLML